MPLAASVDMISWWPCQMKSQSIDEMQMMVWPVSIVADDGLESALRVVMGGPLAWSRLRATAPWQATSGAERR